MVLTNHETTITVRCNNDLKDKAEELANEKGQSLVEWIRRAIKEKIDRETAAPVSAEDRLAELGIGYTDFEDLIRKKVEEMKQKGVI